MEPRVCIIEPAFPEETRMYQVHYESIGIERLNALPPVIYLKC